MGSANTSLFPLPESAVVETVYVRLDDGRLVPRSPEELAELPADQMPQIVAKSAT
jgi:hypothetical protein